MNSIKDKMYNYGVTPPLQSWQIISAALDEDSKDAIPLKKRSKVIFWRLAAASVVGILCSTFIWFGTFHRGPAKIVAKQSTLSATSLQVNKPGVKVTDEKITVPGAGEGEASITEKALASKTGEKLTGSKREPVTKKYITISGPEGQPVKISAKAASLIVSSDDQYPPNTVWNDKVKRWKDIMKANTLAPTTANFLDIVELTHALRIKNP